MRLCDYKNMFGAPGDGLHSVRIADIAVVDTVVVLFVVVIVSKLFNLNFFIVLCTVFIIGILSHRLFCVRTTVDKLLFQL
jgi:ABC-type microcin C transport system permease subunit YejE